MKSNPYVIAALSLIEKMSGKFSEETHLYIHGGIAAAWWRADARTTCDLDIVFEGNDCPDFTSDEIKNDKIYIDANFNDTLSFLQEDYRERAPKIAKFGNLHVHVLAPVDLVCSKLSRLSKKDFEDIEGIIDLGLIDKNEFIETANDALVTYIGNRQAIEANINMVMEKLEQKCDFRP